MTVTQEPKDLVESAEPEPATQGCPCPSRRAVVSAVGVAGLAVALTACGGSDDGGGTDAGQDPTGGASEQPEEGASGGGGGGEELAKTSDIPEGGGAVFKDQGVVVVQPAAGQFKAYSSKCTHAGCAVKDVAGGTINCVCHGSKFSIEDGSVKGGPASKPLPAAQITVDGDSIKLG
ncbi:Rieske (2Fe-2S) protein [Streptomyces indicus]|uniref:Cytochrome bc1 complex Rieske iron-sulfur subunit n=1 Tax=Streptomyces indicus TaxID=417292 RepID=A0A1G9AAG4_9ACTN|nr:Rieske (2Fe-2S) protein [Streptomyces indicus]SDK24253.1 Ferredoxin subunit of nitrite reductase or a ring-hydroxylating dioxygenase [Streptomyces indicus]